MAKGKLVIKFPVNSVKDSDIPTNKWITLFTEQYCTKELAYSIATEFLNCNPEFDKRKTLVQFVPYPETFYI